MHPSDFEELKDSDMSRNTTLVTARVISRELGVARLYLACSVRGSRQS
jgi:hypothetical protein